MAAPLFFLKRKHYSCPFEEVPVDLNNLEKEDGIMARTSLLQQTGSAKELINKHNPERIVVLGGDCSENCVMMDGHVH